LCVGAGTDGVRGGEALMEVASKGGETGCDNPSMPYRGRFSLAQLDHFLSDVP
jgi:hypothetical protein